MVTKDYKENGITLIALVITIIVLLILAGVTLNFALNEKGIISRTKDTKERSEKENLLEGLNLAIAGLSIDYNSKDKSKTFRDYIFSNTPGEGQQKLQEELGDITFDITNYKIIYKGNAFIINNDGEIIESDEETVNSCSYFDSYGDHDWRLGVCHVCGTRHQHTIEDEWLFCDGLGYCAICEGFCRHPNISNSTCPDCGYVCTKHIVDSDSFCVICGEECHHYWKEEDDHAYCLYCNKICYHSEIVGGYCVDCHMSF